MIELSHEDIMKYFVRIDEEAKSHLPKTVTGWVHGGDGPDDCECERCEVLRRNIESLTR